MTGIKKARMGLDFLTHKKYKREAQKIADRIALAYPRILALHPDADEQIVIKDIFLEEMGYGTLPEESKDLVNTCCKTVNGLSYLLALRYSIMLRDAPNFKILQFTDYLDRELGSLGFPPQSPEEKEEILKALLAVVREL
jgi:hypothetical protein